MHRLQDKVAVITGAGSGIGRAAAQLMSAQGASVVVADYDTQAAQETARLITTAGGNALPLTVNVLEEDSITAMIDATVEEYGALHVLCNHVGGTNPRTDLDLLRMDMDEFDRAVTLNMRSTLLGSRHAIPHMIRAGGGSIINTASVAALVGDGHLRVPLDRTFPADRAADAHRHAHGPSSGKVVITIGEQAGVQPPG